MANENYTEIILGKKLSEFKSGLNQIEQRHIEYFKPRKSRIKHLDQYKLISHCDFTNFVGPTTPQLKVVDPDLDQEILNEVMELFDKVFTQKEF